MSTQEEFLERLLDAPAPSGFETRAARVWRDEAETFADSVWTDVSGNTVAALNPEGSPRVMFAGHVDEIGLQVTHVDADGFVFFDTIGGWDPQVLVGQRVRVLGRDKDVPGVVGKKPIHLMETEERSKASKVKELWIDVGASDAEGVAELGIRVGDPAVIASGMVRLAGDRIASRAVDNRIGAYVVLEALRRLARDLPQAAVFAVATSQEEIGSQGGGARPGAWALEPDVAVVVDVTFSTDVPDVSKKELGEHRVGGGPVLTRGSSAHPVVFERLERAAEKGGIPYSIQAQPRSTRTDADAIYLVRAGVPTGLVSVPNRYMHSPSELVSLADVDATAELLARFARELSPDDDFVPR